MALGVVLSLLSAVCFSTSAILAKLGYAQGLTVIQVLQLRFTLAVPLILVLLLIRDRRLPRVSPALVLKGLLLGGILYGIQSSCYYNALLHIPASTASLVLYLYPVVVALLARLFFPPEDRPGRGPGPGHGGGRVRTGLFRRLSEKPGAGGPGPGFRGHGQLFLLHGGPAGGGQKRAAHGPDLFVIVFAAVTFNLAGEPSYLLRISRPGWIYGGGLALFSTVMGLGFLYLAVERLGSAHAAVIFTVEPISVVTLSWLILHERIAAWQVAGMILIVAGIVIKNLLAAGRSGPVRAGRT